MGGGSAEGRGLSAVALEGLDEEARRLDGVTVEGVFIMTTKGKRRPAKPVKPELSDAAREAERDVDSAQNADRSAFVRDPREGPARTADDVAERLAERYLSSATSGEDVDEGGQAEPLDEEDGGPYVTTSALEELAEGTDASNPAETEPAPFPTTQSES